MRSDRGFTLIEVLVGLTLLLLFVSGIYTVAIGTLEARRRIDESAAVYTAGPRILDLIEADLRGAYTGGSEDIEYFKATRETAGGVEVTNLDLVTTSNSKGYIEVDDRQVRSDVTEVGYRMRRNDDFGSVLELYRREQFFFDDEPTKGGEYFLVYDRIRSLTMNFFEQPDTSDTATSTISAKEGKEDWASGDDGGLPMAVKIVLVLAPPVELDVDLETEERSYRFERTVLLPNAWDKQPGGDNDQGPGGG